MDHQDLGPQLEAALDQVLGHLAQIVPHRYATIQLENQHVLRIVAQQGLLDLGSEISQHAVDQDRLYQTVVETGQPLVVPDVRQDVGASWYAALDDACAWVGAPLVDGDQVIGLICAVSDQSDAYDARDAQTLAALADQAVFATQNARLAGRLSRSERLSQALQEVVTLINSNLDFDQVLDEILKQTKRIVPYTSASIHLLISNRLYYAAGHGFPVSSHPDSELSRGENAIFQDIARTKLAMLIEDVREHPDWNTKPGLEYIRSWIGAPLVAKDRVIGYLTLDHNQVGAYTRQDVQTAETLARQVAIAIENARLYTETLRWAEEQVALNTIATAASSSLDLRKMLNHVLDAVHMLLVDVDGTEVRLWDESNEAFYVAARRGAQAPVESPSVSASIRDSAKVKLESHAPLASGAPDKEDFVGEPKGSLATVSLRGKEQQLGSLSIISRTGRQFTAREVSLLEAIGHQVSLAIENARLYEQLKESEARKTGLLRELGKSLQELQEAQARLVQSEKLAAIGRLVSGVAHELNNPLTAVIGYAQMLQATDLPSIVQEDLDRIVEQAQRCARVVQKLLTFGRQHEPERYLVNVNQLIEDTLSLVSNQLTMDNIVVEHALSEEIPVVMADPYQLQQVWLNLIQNAQQAMHDAHGGGVLQVRTLITPEGKILVKFADDGPGIEPDVMEEIFDPFFTTKPVGQGTGLGLSICYGIIVQHEGQIWAENNVQGGSTFIVELPGREADVSEPSPPDYYTPLESMAGARVLVVDDEAPILELVDRMLTRHGYIVEIARDGKEAIERIAHQDYDLILLDLLMPQKGGIDTYQEIVERRPELAKQVIFATGDVATSSTRAFLEETGAPFIAKPFDLSELRQLIRSKLEQQR